MAPNAQTIAAMQEPDARLDGVRDARMEELLHQLMDTPSRCRTEEAVEVCRNAHGPLIYASHYVFVPEDYCASQC